MTNNREVEGKKEKALYGVYWLGKSVWQSAKRSFKVGVSEKKGTKNVYKFDSGYFIDVRCDWTINALIYVTLLTLA